MVSVLFQSEVTTIESQIAELQIQINQLQSRKVALGEAEVTAAGILQVVQQGVAKIAGLAPDAIATLKKSVLNLFDGNDGNQGEQTAADAVIEAEVEELVGQSTEFACLIGNHDLLCEGQLLDPPRHCRYEGSDDRGLPTRVVPYEFTRLMCLLEDAPQSALTGQSVEFACPVSFDVDANQVMPKTATIEAVTIEKAGKETEEENLFELVDMGGTVAYMKRVSDGQIAAVYIGFNNKTKAKAWADWLSVTHSVATKTEVRVAKRLSIFKYEIKASGVSFKSIEKLTGCDFNLDPRKALPDAPKRLPERVPSMVEIENIGVGDTVRSVTVRHWQYKVVEVNADGFYKCERLGTSPIITQVLHPGSVELVRKADVVDQASIELAEHLEAQAEDALNSIQPPLKYNAVPLGRRGADANWRTLQANGGLNLKASGTGLITMAESIEIERQREEAEQQILASKIADEATAYDDF